MNNLAQEARALCDVATPGPWVWEHEKGEMWGENGRVDVAVDGEGHGIQMTKEDGDLCARSRTLLPEMADEIERLKRELNALKYAFRKNRLVPLDSVLDMIGEETIATLEGDSHG